MLNTLVSTPNMHVAGPKFASTAVKRYAVRQCVAKIRCPKESIEHPCLSEAPTVTWGVLKPGIHLFLQWHAAQHKMTGQDHTGNRFSQGRHVRHLSNLGDNDAALQLRRKLV